MGGGGRWKLSSSCFQSMYEPHPIPIHSKHAFAMIEADARKNLVDTDRINRDLRCQYCHVFAYVDLYEGEYDGKYTCLHCLRLGKKNAS